MPLTRALREQTTPPEADSQNRTQAGLTLGKIEKLGLLSTAEKLGGLSLLENVRAARFCPFLCGGFLKLEGRG